MSFNAKYSNQSVRLNSGRDDAWQVHDEAVAMQQRGEDVVVLSIGDPDFRTPEPIIDHTFLPRSIHHCSVQTPPHPE